MSVKYEQHDDVAVVTLDRPESFNAITADLAHQLVDALERAGRESRAMVLTGAGKAFCAGADLGEIAAGYEANGPNLGAVLDDHFHPAVLALVNCKVPTVAAINGAAAGAGLGLALGCDLRLMSENSFLMSAFAGIGLAPDSGTTWWLPAHVGVSRALEITMTNRRVLPEEAFDLGLCLRVVAAGELDEAAMETATGLADLSTDALVSTRALVREASVTDFASTLQAERQAQHRLGLTAEHMEGVTAFLEKRKPDYRSAGS
ncbi:MAG TPA: enoyl-CoA hydratase-related protein [Acidimicrobiia bacterium]